MSRIGHVVREGVASSFVGQCLLSRSGATVTPMVNEADFISLDGGGGHAEWFVLFSPFECVEEGYFGVAALGA